jgi:hypothetical protein
MIMRVTLLSLLLVTFLTLSSGPWAASEGSSGGNQLVKSAQDIWSELMLSSVDLVARPIEVFGTDGVGELGTGATFGAEKEASSSMLTRVMGPNDVQFKKMVETLPEQQRADFLRDFFSNWLKNSNGYRTFVDAEGAKVDLAFDVYDVKGNQKIIDLNPFKQIDWAQASVAQLDQKFTQWLELTDQRPFSFIKPTIRRKIFNGDMPGLSSTHAGEHIGRHSYPEWTALFGDAEKYIDSAHTHHGGQHGGWEINFKPQKTFGEFQEMIDWFKLSLAIKDSSGEIRLFQAPGHQRMVFAKHPSLNMDKLAEVFKMIQALIVVDGVKGGTGIEVANFKSVHSDSVINELSAGRGVIRLEGERFGANTFGVEFRAGTKDARVSRFVQMAVASRVATNDFGGIADSKSWKLIESDLRSITSSYARDTLAKKLAKRYDVKQELVNKAMKKLEKTGLSGFYIVPLWNWINPKNPFVKKTKRDLLKDMTKDFITQVASIEQTDYETIRFEVRKLMKHWLRGANLSTDIRTYLMPTRTVKVSDKIDQFPVRAGNAVVDVNKIDLGIEYSGRFPLKLQTLSDYEGMERGFHLPNDKKPWIMTLVDLSDKERKKVIKKVATDLKKALGGGGEVKLIEEDGHGHGLDVAFAFKDGQDRKWRVEWDGISRTYLPDGTMIEHSPRGGSIELVTPKFVPQLKEMDAVYSAFEKNGIIPNAKGGGGHINIDLAPFDGKPKQMARFLSTFLEHRGIISLMFQHINRLKAGEPININADLARKLKDFNGNETELKKLLYDKRYFNTRVGRKTRYTQLDLSAYFQDVIPEQYITDDYDIINHQVAWRKQFRVDPKIRKGEFRLFDAPKNTAESALQIKLVRAILNKAFNEDSVLSGEVQAVSHENYVNHPEKAEADLKKLCDSLGLDIDEYRPMMAQGLYETDFAVHSKIYKNLEEKLRPYRQVSEWGRAVDPRPKSQAISSEGRVWSAEDAAQVRASNTGEFIPLNVRSAEIQLEIYERGQEEGIPAGRFIRSTCLKNASRMINQ